MLLLLLFGSKSMVSYRDSGSAGRMCANTGALTQVFQSESDLFALDTSGFGLFLFKSKPYF